MTETSANERLQKAAKAFLDATKAITLPPGEIANCLSEKTQKQGLNLAMRALGEIIGQQQDMAMLSANKELLAKLGELCETKVTDLARFGEEPFNALDAVLAVAYSGESGATQLKIQELRDAFRHNNRPIFDEILRILTDISINCGMQIDDEIDDTLGTNAPERPQDKPQGWRASLKDDRGAVDDNAIRRAAKEHDKDKPPVSDADITKSAAGGSEFRITDEHRTEYEQGENDIGRDIEYTNTLGDGYAELKQYRTLCKQLKASYDSTLGTCLEPAGVAASKK